MNIASTIYNAGALTNKALTEGILSKNENTLNMLRSFHNVARFIKETPENLNLLLQVLSERFQDYVPDLSGLANIAPLEAFLGRFKDYLTFIELPFKIQKLFEEIKNGGSKIKITSCSIQVAQKFLESTLLANSWNLINLAQYSFINIGYISTVKEFCVLISSSINVYTYSQDITKHTEKLNYKKQRLAEDHNAAAVLTVINSAQAEINELEEDEDYDYTNVQKALQAYLSRKKNQMSLNDLQGNAGYWGPKHAALVNKLQKHINEQARADKIKVKLDTKDKYVSRYFQDHFLNNGFDSEIPAAPNTLPESVQGEINQIAKRDKLSILKDIFIYKKHRTQDQITNAQTDVRKAVLGRRFDIAKVVIVTLGLCIALPFLAQVAAGIGISIIALQVVAWIFTLAVGGIGIWKTINAAYYSEKVLMPPRLLQA